LEKLDSPGFIKPVCFFVGRDSLKQRKSRPFDDRDLIKVAFEEISLKQKSLFIAEEAS
jgi:hypothetical protein